MQRSKLPNTGASIFSTIAQLSRKHQAINLGQGFPNFDGSSKLKDLVSKYMQAGKNQYAPMTGVPDLRQAISRKISNLYDVELNPDTDITISAGATQAISCTISAFVHPGDEVIIIEPAYDSYKPSIEIAGGIAVPYGMGAPSFKIDWNKIRELITDKTSMIITNTPHNPTASILSEEDIVQLQDIVLSNNLILMSDEVYEHIIFDGLQHESILKYPDLYQRSIVTFSFGKTFHNTGWKIGYSVAPHHLSAEIRKIHQWNVFSVNSFIQYALAEFLEDENEYLSLSSFYQKKRDYFNEVIKGTSLRPLNSSGTYFQLFDYSAISQDDDLAFTKQLIEKHGVASIPVSVFYSDNKQDNVIRFCFAKTEDVLEQAGEVLRKI